MRIGFACRPETSNGHYRVLLPLSELARRGHRVISPEDVSYKEALAGVPDWDLLHLHQYVNDENLDVVRRLRAAGVAVVWDSDDDMRSAPTSRKAGRPLGSRRAVRRVFRQSVEMARSVHLMTTTSEHLAQIYRDEGVEHVTVIGNYLARVEVPGRRRRHVGCVIGIVASSEHAPDVDGLRIVDALAQVQRRHDHVSVVAFGVDLKLRERYLHTAKVPFDQLLARVRDFDIGIAPLVDSPFSRSRSNVKLKEYAAAGVPWLASPVGPYVGMGHEQGGRLVADGDWVDVLDQLVGDPRARVELARRARAWARTQTIQQVGSAWENAFLGAVARAREEAGRPLAGTRRRWGT